MRETNCILAVELNARKVPKLSLNKQGARPSRQNRLACNLNDNESPPNNQRTPESLKIHKKRPYFVVYVLTAHRAVQDHRFPLVSLFLFCAKEISRPTQTAVSNRISYTAFYADRNRVASHLLSWNEIHDQSTSTSVPLLRKLVLCCIPPFFEFMLHTLFYYKL